MSILVGSGDILFESGYLPQEAVQEGGRDGEDIDVELVRADRVPGVHARAAAEVGDWVVELE